VSLSDDDRASVSAATETIASRKAAVDLSPSTVRRVLYELAADAGLLDRVTARRSDGKGRPPESARPVPRFPTLVFSGAVRPALVVGLIRLHRLFRLPSCCLLPLMRERKTVARRHLTSDMVPPSRWTSTGR